MSKEWVKEVKRMSDKSLKESIEVLCESLHWKDILMFELLLRLKKGDEEEE